MNKQQTSYKIFVQGYLDQGWSEWFDGWTIEHREDGSTMLMGTVPDQTALHGVLVKIRNLGLTLISLKMIDYPKRFTRGK